MEDAKYLDLMAKYLSGNLTGQERAELFAWVEANADNRKFFEEMIQLWSISKEYEEEPFETDVEAAWEQVDRRLSNPGVEEAPSGAAAPSAKIFRLSKGRRWFRYAALILLLVTAAAWVWIDPLGWRLTTIAAIEGEVREITLPDGSEVWLNEETTIAYRRPFWQRHVELSGEAFFEVERLERRPFRIQSGGATTTVLGTSFNVRAYPEESVVEVTVKTGTVRLQDRDQPEEEVILNAGNAGIYLQDAEEVRKVETETENADAWKTRELNFYDTPLREVLQTLRRYYKVEIEVENETILRCPTFVWNSGPDPQLEETLAILETYLEDGRFEKVDERAYILRGEGCE
jgi:ferric-dicitrate binding protein FerR (iron transport regulator)